MVVSFRLKTLDEDSANRAYHGELILKKDSTGRRSNTYTCVAAYAMEPLVTPVMPCIRAFPDLVALASLSTELGEVNMCLNVCDYSH